MFSAWTKTRSGRSCGVCSTCVYDFLTSNASSRIMCYVFFCIIILRTELKFMDKSLLGPHPLDSPCIDRAINAKFTQLSVLSATLYKLSSFKEDPTQFTLDTTAALTMHMMEAWMLDHSCLVYYFDFGEESQETRILYQGEWMVCSPLSASCFSKCRFLCGGLFAQ